MDAEITIEVRVYKTVKAPDFNAENPCKFENRAYNLEGPVLDIEILYLTFIVYWVSQMSSVFRRPTNENVDIKYGMPRISC